MPMTPQPTLAFRWSPRRQESVFFAGLMLMLRAIGLFAAVGSISAASAAPALPTGTLAHGPFEIVIGARRIAAGSLDKGNVFATREVSEFQVRWRGKLIAAPGGNQRFWRVLRLAVAPRPALLLVTQGFVLATEDATGRLQLTPINAQSNSLAEVQWLDSANGQPGPSETFGIEAVTDLQAGTQLAGGRWLRLGTRSVMDVSTLTVFPVAPWVPAGPGVPDTYLPRAGDDARAFSPDRTQYALAAEGIDYSRADHAQAYGLLVVDIARGTATELRADRKRFRFATPKDVNAAWINHHFVWQRDGAGRERLVPRERFAPWPWRARLTQPNVGRWQLNVPRIDAAFFPTLRRLIERELGVRIVEASAKPADSLVFSLDGCTLNAQAFGEGSPFADDHDIGIWEKNEKVSGANAAGCEAALRRLATVIDAELATGRHDALFKLD